MKILDAVKKIDPKVYLSLGLGAAGLVQMILKGKVESSEREALKEALKAEIINEINSKKD